MAGFMEACSRASRVIVPMLDTIIQMNIRPDETAYISSAKGTLFIYLLIIVHCNNFIIHPGYSLKHKLK